MNKDEIELLIRKKARIKEEYEEEAAELAKAAKEARDEYNKLMDELMKNPKWGCTSVLKGPVEFIGCERKNHRDPGFPCVSCVTTSGDFDYKFDTSPENLPKIKPYFKYDPVIGKSQYGASGTEYYDGEGFSNVHGNLGFESFVVRESNGRMSTRDTRQGSCPYPKPVPPELSVKNPDTREKFQLMLVKGNTSTLSERKALKWLETHPLVFPNVIDSTFADRAFDWVHALSIQFQEPLKLSLPSATISKMMGSSTQASVAAMQSPGMRQLLLSKLTKQPMERKSIFKGCKCTPTVRDPTCQNQFCPFRNAVIQRVGFEWPQLEFASGDPAARLALEDEISGATRAEAAKQEAAAAAAAAAAAKQKREDEKREERNARARSATARRRESAAAAKAASAASAAPSAPSVRRRSAKASAEPEAREVNPPSTDLTDSYEQKTIRRRAKGGAKSKSKSKRRLRK